MMVSKEQLLLRLQHRLFSKQKIVQNNFRGELVEEIVASVLAKQYNGAWKHCSEDWGAWDFKNEDDIFIQVKQAAARQSWDDIEKVSPSQGRGVFSIAVNTGAYGEEKWVSFDRKDGPKSGRIAQIYIFGWHDDREISADHFDLERWTFFVALSWELPERKATITVRQLIELVEQGKAWRGSLGELSLAVDRAREQCKDAPDACWRKAVIESLKSDRSTPPSPPATS